MFSHPLQPPPAGSVLQHWLLPQSSEGQAVLSPNPILFREAKSLEEQEEEKAAFTLGWINHYEIPNALSGSREISKFKLNGCTVLFSRILCIKCDP